MTPPPDVRVASWWVATDRGTFARRLQQRQASSQRAHDVALQVAWLAQHGGVPRSVVPVPSTGQGSSFYYDRARQVQGSR